MRGSRVQVHWIYIFELFITCNQWHSMVTSHTHTYTQWKTHHTHMSTFTIPFDTHVQDTQTHTHSHAHARTLGSPTRPRYLLTVEAATTIGLLGVTSGQGGHLDTPTTPRSHTHLNMATYRERERERERMGRLWKVNADGRERKEKR